jgi:hypothetical protein
MKHGFKIRLIRVHMNKNGLCELRNIIYLATSVHQVQISGRISLKVKNNVEELCLVGCYAVWLL